RLVALGYQRTDLVERPGDFAVRGRIIYGYPPGDGQPRRIESFGDEIDSLRRVGVGSARRVADVEAGVLGRAREPAATAQARAAAAARRELERAEARLRASNPEAAARLARRVGEDLDALETGRPFPGMARYVAYAYPDAATPAALMPPDSICVVDDWPRVAE